MKRKNDVSVSEALEELQRVLGKDFEAQITYGKKKKKIKRLDLWP